MSEESYGCPECGLYSCVCYDDDDEPYDDDGLDDCSMGPDGYCGAAGSEYCDWECPLHNTYFGTTPNPKGKP
jgi:hypothetical protein